MKMSLAQITVKTCSTIFSALTKAQRTDEKQKEDEVTKKTQWILLMILIRRLRRSSLASEKLCRVQVATDKQLQYRRTTMDASAVLHCVLSAKLHDTSGSGLITSSVE